MALQLRFMEWTSNWNICKIGDIAEIIGGGTPRTEIDSYWDGDIKWFTPSEIGKSKYIFESERHITEKGLKNSSAKLLPKYTILLSSRASVGEVSIALTECSTNQGFQSLITKNNVDNEFIYYLISTMKNEFLKKSSGSTFLEISKNELKRININIPTLDEQKRISDFFSTLDNKIKLLNNKHKYYQDFKKYLLQQIFTSAEKLQFDYKQDIGMFKLKELCTVTKGKQLNKDCMIDNGEFYVLNGGVNPSGFTNNWNTMKNTISISEGGNSCGYVNFNTENFWSGGHCYTLDSLKKNVNVYYLYSFLKAIESKIMRLRVGSGLPNIQKGDIESLLIAIPHLKEQEKIANFLSAVDKKIDLIQTQIDEMEKFKKGLLQQMFI